MGTGDDSARSLRHAVWHRADRQLRPRQHLHDEAVQAELTGAVTQRGIANNARPSRLHCRWRPLAAARTAIVALIDPNREGLRRRSGRVCEATDGVTFLRQKLLHGQGDTLA